MTTESSTLINSKEQKFLNHHKGYPEAAAGNRQNQYLEEGLVATRNQHRKRLESSLSQSNKRPRVDLSPIVYTTTRTIGGKLPTRPMIVLLDSGSSHTMIKDSSLPHRTMRVVGQPKRTTTTNGVFSTTSSVILENVKFPEFGNQCIDTIQADVFNSPTCRYDVILGRDVLDVMGAMIDFKANTISWMGREIPMKSTRDLSSSHINQVELLHNQFSSEENEDYDIFAELYADDVVIMDRKYQAVTPDEVVRQLPHLNTQQKSKLKMVFEKYKTVFDGTLGKHPTAKIDIQLVPGAKPIYQNPYPVLFKRKPLFDRELSNMIADGVFTKIGESEWGFPSFIIPKKDG